MLANKVVSLTLTRLFRVMVLKESGVVHVVHFMNVKATDYLQYTVLAFLLCKYRTRVFLKLFPTQGMFIGINSFK